MRYIIGIDLGTTNCCVTYIDLEAAYPSPQQFMIQQLVDLGYVSGQDILPSYCYLSEEGEFTGEQLRLPWGGSDPIFVGKLAQSLGSKTATRLVSSAKSWLCYGAADRKGAILPPSEGAARRISPVEATSRYLAHIRACWDHTMARSELEKEFSQQEIIITVPASFDEVARQLTVEAAKRAGYGALTLLEEPQAAFYSWISQHEKNWNSLLKPNERILVCDIGGGTTDFSLIDVVEKENGLTFERMAVGDHLLLGGDNLDAALSHLIEKKLQNIYQQELTAAQWLQLKNQARLAKETLLGKGSPPLFKIVLQGLGSHIVLGSMSAEVTKEEVNKLLLEGFFPSYSFEESLQLQKARGVRSLGLPYEDDPAITKQLATFLSKASRKESKEIFAPAHLLFNGGTMHAEPFQNAILEALNTWFPNQKINLLESVSLDTAVARGASYYGKVRRGLGIKIGSGLPRTFYLGVQEKQEGILTEKALTLLPRGSEEGFTFKPEWPFSLKPNSPVSFTLYSSQVRLADKPGDLLAIDSLELQKLPPLNTFLVLGKKNVIDQNQNEKIPVHVKATLTPLGTIEVAIKSVKTPHHWNLEFQVRNLHGQEDSAAMLAGARRDKTISNADSEAAGKIIFDSYSGEGKIDQVVERLEELFGQKKQEWSASTLRGLWEPLLLQYEASYASEKKQLRWWNLAGFCLRPGYGYPLDDFRVKTIWKLMLAQKSVKEGNLFIQLLICYRRIAGGLNKGQQSQLAADLFTLIAPKGEKKGKKQNDYIYSECIRALAACERLPTVQKIKLGDYLINKIREKKAIPADFFALARLGARHLSYGAITDVIDKPQIELWLEELLKETGPMDEKKALLFALWTHHTGLREIDLSLKLREAVKELLQANGFSTILEEKALTDKEEELLLGDTLPTGLILE